MATIAERLVKIRDSANRLHCEAPLNIVKETASLVADLAHIVAELHTPRPDAVVEDTYIDEDTGERERYYDRAEHIANWCLTNPKERDVSIEQRITQSISFAMKEARAAAFREAADFCSQNLWKMPQAQLAQELRQLAAREEST